MDLARLVSTRLLVQANSGGGKSWQLRLLAELMADYIQVVILDPKGEFATLRELVDLALVEGGGKIATEVRTGRFALILSDLRGLANPVPVRLL